jgi:hypothetical protein
MTKDFERIAKARRPEVACKKCGETTFHRNVEEEASLVKLFMKNGYIDDEVIQEGDRQFTYECAECYTIFDDNE